MSENERFEIQVNLNLNKELVIIDIKSLFDDTLISLFQDQTASIRMKLNEHAVSVMRQELEARGYEIVPGTCVLGVRKKED